MKTKVTLLSYTRNPIETLTKVWQASRDNEPIKMGGGDLDLFQKIIDSKIPVAEMLDFVFLLEGVSIAFREQMVRHRIGVKVGDRLGCDFAPDLADSAWWSQSMRILDMGEFCAEDAYEIPESVRRNPTAGGIYDRAMYSAAQAYRLLIEDGVPMEEARLVIPLAAQHRIVWKLNLASLMHIIGKRGCWILQLGFWGPVIKGMVDELCRQIDPVFRNLVSPPCLKDDEFTGCLFKLDNQRRIEGEDEIPPCPLYLVNHFEEAQNAAIEREAVWRFQGGCFTTQGSFTCGDANKRDRQQRMLEEYEELWQRDPWTGKRK